MIRQDISRQIAAKDDLHASLYARTGAKYAARAVIVGTLSGVSPAAVLQDYYETSGMCAAEFDAAAEALDAAGYEFDER